MTPEQKMQAIVEAAEECWHEYDSFREKEESISIHCPKCPKCKKNAPYTNPSPTDLNELCRLADKLVWEYKTSYMRSAITHKFRVIVVKDAYTMRAAANRCSAVTQSEAMLNALYDAIKDKT